MSEPQEIGPRLTQTQHGFIWGAAEVERTADHARGWVLIAIKTPKHPRGIDVFVTKGGKVRIFGSNGGEWTPPPKPAANGARMSPARPGQEDGLGSLIAPQPEHSER